MLERGENGFSIVLKFLRMKLLLLCTACFTAVFSVPTYSDNGPFDHFTEVFDDNIAMPSEPRDVEHRELVEPVQPIRPRPRPVAAFRRPVPQALPHPIAAVPQGVRAPVGVNPYRNFFFANPQSPAQAFKPQNFYPLKGVQIPYNQPLILKNDQYPLYYQPQEFIPYFPQQAEELFNYPYFPKQPFINPGVSIAYLFRPPVQQAQIAPSAPTSEAVVVDARPEATRTDPAPDKESPEKEFGSEKNGDAAVETKIEKEDAPVVYEEGSLQEDELFKITSREEEAIDVQLDGSGAEPIANDESDAPTNLLTFIGGVVDEIEKAIDDVNGKKKKNENN